MKCPAPLKKGDMIGVCAPSSYVSAEELENAAKMLRERGYGVFLHPQCFVAKGDTQFGGTPEQKVEALHDLTRSPDIKAIFYATGGTRCLSILDLLDYKLIKKNPKIHMGFSDHTALLNTITARTGMTTYHGPTMKRLPKTPQLDFDLRLLAGEEKSIPLKGAQILKEGSAKGILVGGNLTMFRTLPEKDIPKTKGAILFFEEINEEWTTTERDIAVLARAGLFKNAAGIIFGQFTNMKDTGTPFYLTNIKDIITEHTKGLNIPILTDVLFGHDGDLPVFPIGQKMTLNNATLFL